MEAGVNLFVRESFNRTFMELKFYWRCEDRHLEANNGFNRTFMELK